MSYSEFHLSAPEIRCRTAWTVHAVFVGRRNKQGYRTLAAESDWTKPQHEPSGNGKVGPDNSDGCRPAIRTVAARSERLRARFKGTLIDRLDSNQ